MRDAKCWGTVGCSKKGVSGEKKGCKAGKRVIGEEILGDQSSIVEEEDGEEEEKMDSVGE